MSIGERDEVTAKTVMNRTGLQSFRAVLMEVVGTF